MVSGVPRLLMAGLGLTITVGLALLLWVPRGVAPLDVAGPQAGSPHGNTRGVRSGPATAEPVVESRPADAAVERVAVAADLPRDLAVRVRTSFGAPAPAMPVRFVWSSANVLERFTGPDGCAALRSAELPPGGGQLRAEVACVGQSAATASLAPCDWPAEPVVLDLPPLVTVRAMVTDPDGLPARDPGRVRLDCLRDGKRFASLNEAYAAGEATASFWRVPAGASLELRALEGTRERAFVRLDGPFAVGTEVHALLRRTLATCALFGRLVDASGQPLRRQVFTVSLFPSGGTRLEEETRTHDHGEFRVPLARTWQGHPLDRVLFSIGTSFPRLPFQDAAPEVGERLARLALPGHIEERLQEVGNVTMRGLERLASGQLELVDLDGDWVRQTLPRHLDLIHASATAAPSPDAVASRDLLEMVLLRVHSAFGHFAVHGIELPAGTWLVARPGYWRATAPLLLRAGAHDHRLVLVPTSVIQVQATLDPADIMPSFWLRAKAGGTRHSIFQSTRGGNVFEGSFVQVPAGSYSLLFRRNPGAETEVVLEDVAIEPGPLCRDPRMKALDLRSGSKR